MHREKSIEQKHGIKKSSLNESVQISEILHWESELQLLNTQTFQLLFKLHFLNIYLIFQLILVPKIHDLETSHNSSGLEKGDDQWQPSELFNRPIRCRKGLGSSLLLSPAIYRRHLEKSLNHPWISRSSLNISYNSCNFHESLINNLNFPKASLNLPETFLNLPETTLNLLEKYSHLPKNIQQLKSLFPFKHAV